MRLIVTTNGVSRTFPNIVTQSIINQYISLRSDTRDHDREDVRIEVRGDSDVVKDYPLANCGCVYHAEHGIPCKHDLALRSSIEVDHHAGEA